MSKTNENPLQAALSVVVPETEATTEEPKQVEPTIRKGRPDRAGTVMIGGHFPRSVKQQLRMIAAEEDTTSQALLTEALNLLFVKKGKTHIV